MKKQPVVTAAQELLKDKELLTSRPEGMDFEAYKVLLNMQNKLIKKALQKNPSLK